MAGRRDSYARLHVRFMLRDCRVRIPSPARAVHPFHETLRSDCHGTPAAMSYTSSNGRESRIRIRSGVTVTMRHQATRARGRYR